MDANEILESYVRDVADCLPRARRDDVASELRSLLAEELAGRAQESGRPPDRAMAMAMLQAFGRPAEYAQRYHARPALVEGADNHHFLIWATGGAVVLLMHAALNPQQHVDLDGLFLQWLGLLLLWFALAGWIRRRRPGVFRWKPSHGPEWMPRGLSALSLVATLLFPVWMYAAPQPFARMLLPSTLSVEGLALDPVFATSGIRLLTMALLVGLALGHAIALLLGRQPAWLRRCGVAVNLALGLLFVIHASPMATLDGRPFQVFASAHANTVAAPIFLGLGGMMLLVGLYYAWREWTGIDPAPMRGEMPAA